jgi:APA family basic amino acid/polyamine antiporter
MQEQNKETFRRKLNLFDSSAMVIGSMIGSGIFIVSAEMSLTVGAPGWLLVAWAVTGIMTIMAAMSFGEMASMFPHAGGLYVYLREAYGPIFGFLYGWTHLLVIQGGTIAAVAMAFSKFLGVIFPSVSTYNLFLHVGSFQIDFVELVAILSIVVITWINSKGVEEGKIVQNVFTVLKIAILLFIIIIGLSFAAGTESSNFKGNVFERNLVNDIGVPGIVTIPLLAALAISMVGSLFSSDAWYNITFASGEVVNPRKTIPRSMIIGTFTVAVLYFMVNYTYLRILPFKGSPEDLSVLGRGIQFAEEGRVATAAMYQVLGKAAETLMAIVLVVSTFGCNNGLILSGARVYYAMAKDDLFFKPAGYLNSKGVPGIGLTIQAIWCSLLCLSGTYNQLLLYVVFAVLLFNILLIAALFIFRIKLPHAERPYKAIGYPVIPVLYICLCAFIMIVLLIYKPEYTWRGLIVAITGIPVYFIWKKWQQNRRKA